MENKILIKFTSNSNGNATNYSNLSQTEVIERLQKSILDETLIGSNIRFGKNSKAYIFTLKDDPYESKRGKITIVTNSKIYDKDDANILALDSISRQMGQVKVQRTQKIMALLVAGTIALTSYGPAIARNFKDSANEAIDKIVTADNSTFQKETQNINDYVAELNKARAENGVGPVGISNEAWRESETEALKQAEKDYLETNKEEQFRKELEDEIIVQNGEEMKGRTR